MSTFCVTILKVDEVIDHPFADRLSINKIKGFNTISAKLEDGSHRYKANDLVIYIPENGLVPEPLLKKGFWDHKNNKGMLAGSQGNRVKPIKLRQILSEGILYSVNMFDGFDPENHFCLEHSFPDEEIFEGKDVTKLLGILKWEPAVPTQMAGEAKGNPDTIKYDIENIKNFPGVLQEGEEVYISEKCHGTLCQIGMFPFRKDEELFEDQFFITSKGLGAKGISLKKTDKNKDNLYVKAFYENVEKFKKLEKKFYEFKKVVFFGEIFGKGVQDLHYGLQKPELRLFDIWADGSFIDYVDFNELCLDVGLTTVPYLYVGPFSNEKLLECTNGLTTYNNMHVREGCVIKPITEREDIKLGRVILKSINPDYLVRKGETTEYN